MNFLKRTSNPSIVDFFPNLYRGISVGEMIDILKTGKITGKGNIFSGDKRNNLVFFGDKSPDEVIWSASDVERYVRSNEPFSSRLEEIINQKKELQLLEKKNLLQELKINKMYKKISEELTRIQKEINKKAKELEKKLMFQYGVVGFVIHLKNVNEKGVVFESSKKESFHISDEIGFDRENGVSSSFIYEVYPVTKHKNSFIFLEPVSMKEIRKLLKFHFVS